MRDTRLRTGLTVEVPFPAGAMKGFVQTGSGAHPASYPRVPGALSSGVKRPGREADHSPPSSPEIKNAWSYTSIPQYVFMTRFVVNYRIRLYMTWYLVKPRDGFNVVRTD
jgi:hypothetical protein